MHIQGQSWGWGILIRKDLNEWLFKTPFILQFDKKRLDEMKNLSRNTIAFHLVKKTIMPNPVKCLQDIQRNSYLKIDRLSAITIDALAVDLQKQKSYRLCERRHHDVRCLTNSELINLVLC